MRRCLRPGPVLELVGFTLARALSAPLSLEHGKHHPRPPHHFRWSSPWASLLVGVFAMGKGGDFNKKNSNKLMRFRILFQAGAVVCFVLYMLAR